VSSQMVESSRRSVAEQPITEVEVGEAAFLCLKGEGEPGGAAFREGIRRIYAVLSRLRRAYRRAGGKGFHPGPLECLWDPEEAASTPRDRWHWRLLIRVPDTVTEATLDAARIAVEDPRGTGPAPVWLLRWREGRAIETLHVGPHQTVTAAYDALEAYAQVHAMVVTGPAHEIFLSDPRRTGLGRPRTQVRTQVREQ
jgi:hypothetical protein